jgi:hypothetical protein
MENDRRRTAVASIALAAAMAIIVMFLTLNGRHAERKGRRAPGHNGIGQATSARSTGRASAPLSSADVGLRVWDSEEDRFKIGFRRLDCCGVRVNTGRTR